MQGTGCSKVHSLLSRDRRLNTLSGEEKSEEEEGRREGREWWEVPGVAFQGPAVGEEDSPQRAAGAEALTGVVCRRPAMTLRCGHWLTSAQELEGCWGAVRRVWVGSGKRCAGWRSQGTF